MSKLLKLILPLLLLGLSACSSSYHATSAKTPSLMQTALVGVVAGTLVGAGTGAIIGATIPSGDVGMSALLGAAIGAPVGAIAYVGYQNHKQDQEIADNNAKIRANYEYIVARQEQINRQREEQIDESFRVFPSKSRRSEIYIGPTIGVSK